MTELERVLLAKLEQIEQRHEQQTEDLRQQLQQQAHSLSALQKVC
ncbi:mobilization protein, partial [Aeromonas salmonicida]|nr:mobilization protein [Aeromonas salmonicida]